MAATIVKGSASRSGHLGRMPPHPRCHDACLEPAARSSRIDPWWNKLGGDGRPEI